MSGTQGNNFASSNRVSIRYIAETNWGVVPAAGTSRELRYTSSSLAVKKGTTESTEIRDDRMISNIVQTDMSAGGDFKFEFSAGSQDDFFQAFLMGTWTRPMGFDMFASETISWGTPSVIYIQGGDNTALYVTGRRIKTEGFHNQTNNGYHQVASSLYNAVLNRTEVTVTTAAGVPEADVRTAKLLDANDVLVMGNTTIRAGTAGASAFDSNGSNAFASAIAAGQLQIGQNIFVDGLGFASGTITVAPAVLPTAGDTLVLTDGTDNDGSVYSATLVAGSSYVIDPSEAVTAANIAAAINALRYAAEPVMLSASVAGTVITVRNLGASGGSMTAPVNTGASLTVAPFAGGQSSARGFFTVTGVSDDVLLVTPNPGTNANAGALGVTVKGSMLRNPSTGTSIVTQSFDIETEFNDIGKYLVATGQRVSDFDLDISATKICTGSFTFMGKQQNSLLTPVLALAPYVVLPTTTTEVMNGTTNVGDILKNSVSIATAVQQITMKGNANLRAQQAVSSKYPVGIGTGRFALSGTIVAYFEDMVLYSNFLNHDTVSLSFPMTDEDDQTYIFTIPAAKITSDPISPEGMDQDIMEKMDWMAQRDPLTACMMQMDRFSSVAPV